MEKTSKLPSLTTNGQKLIQKLAELPHTWLTTSTLAEAIGISRRTVLRELPGVEQWMLSAGFQFLRRPGQGILLDEDEEGRQRLRRQLGCSDVNAGLSKKERQQRLLAALFSADGPQKAHRLSSELMISEHTLSSDLDQLEALLSPYQLKLRRKPGVGVWLEGTPEKRRRAIGSLLRTMLPKESLQTLLRGDFSPDSPLAGLLRPSVVSLVWGILQQFEQDEGIHFTDTGFLSLAIHLTLTVQQLQDGVRDGSFSLTSAPLPQAERLAKRVKWAFHLELPPAEVGYLSVYLEAYQGAPLSGDWATARELDLHYLAATLINRMEHALEIDLSPYASLPEDLCSHLRPMLHRLKQNIVIENPQLKAMQEQYFPLWQATRLACDQTQELLGLPPIPDSEAAYLAMHFGAVIEQDALKKTRLNAVVVCPFGMASCRFLAAQLVREFPIFHIQGSRAVRELDPDSLRDQGVDLILSTIPLQIEFPHLCINPILQEQDRAVLQNAVDQFRKSPPPSPHSAQAAHPPETLRYARELSAAILELLDTLTIQTIPFPGDRLALIEEASRLFTALPAPSGMVKEALLRRETLGDTYIEPLGALLLHCKTRAVSGCRLGYLRADPPVHEPGRVIQGALVLLAPEGDSPIPVKVMQNVSSLLIEEPELMEALRAGSCPKAAAILERGLTRRFRHALSCRWRQQG